MSQSLVGNWNYPTSIRFGAGRIRELPDACKAVGLKRPLLVTDPGLAKLPMIADAMLSLRKAGLEVALFSDVKPNPVASNVNSGVAVLRAGKSDGVIAWGGGSGIDTAKAIAFMAGQTRPLWDFGRHRLGDRPGLGDHQPGDAHQEGDFSSQDDAVDRHRRS
jgi:alcohol dehydrogenase class IV